MQPLIAMPSRFTTTAETWRVPATALGQPYQDALARAGGVPVAVPPLFGVDAATAAEAARSVLARVDGLCVPGGPDADPHRYGAAAVHPKTYGVRAEHDEIDLALLRAAIDARKPVLAICRGHQLLNIALGGTLHQHVPDLIGDAAAGHYRNVHEVKVESPSRVAAAMGTQAPRCHCVHHQAVDVPGDGLVVTAWSDGVVEAVEGRDPGHWLVGVQWHPEDTAPDDPEQQRLFDAFVDACR